MGGAKRFGNGKCGRASHSASISSLSLLLLLLSLWNVCNAKNSRDISFFELWLSWCCIWTYIFFLRVGVRVHSLSVLLKLRVRAKLTEIWIRLHIYLRLLETHLFYFMRQCTLILIFFFYKFFVPPPPTSHPPTALPRPPPPVSCRIEFGMIWLVDWLIWLVCLSTSVFLLVCLVFFFPILIFILAMNRRGCCLSVNALCCFRHNSSSHVFFRVDLMLHNPPNIFSLPLITQWHFLCLLLPLLPPTACICTLTIHNLAKCICVPFFFFFLLSSVCYWNVTMIGERMPENVIR